ncbi:hypothetical protein BLSTO_04497 [Blastocystis sp. subtype 1]
MNDIEKKESAPPVADMSKVELNTPKNSITAIKKRITVLNNQDGLKQIQNNLEGDAICNSVGIVERALTQVEECDFMKDYISADAEELEKKDILTLSKQYAFDVVNKHPVTSITISPFQHSFFLLSYHSSLTQTLETNGYFALWDEQIADHPYRILFSNEPVTCAVCHPTDKDLVIGAQVSGHVGVWSVADGTLRSISDQKEPRHTNRVVGLAVLKTALASALASVSQDGVVCVWSPASLARPVVAVHLKDLTQEARGQEAELVPSALSGFDARASCVLVGCEDGRVAVLSVRNNVVAAEAVAAVHAGMVTSIDLEVLPRELTLVASAGMDWSVKVWSEERPGEPLFCLPCSSFVVAVKWHPKNPNLLLVACEKGVVELWNVLKDRECPLASVRVSSDCGITAVAWKDSGRQALVGLESGAMVTVDVLNEVRWCGW